MRIFKILKILFLGFVFITFLPKIGSSQVVNDYRSATTGDWNVLETWERWSGTAWVTPTAGQGTPTNAVNVITIQSPHVVTVTANVTVDQMTINAGGEVTVENGVTLTVNNGSGTDLTNNGSFTSNGTLTVTASTVLNNGTFTSNGVLGGTGTFTQGASASLAIGGTITITTLTATAAGNTVDYTGVAQAVKATTYVNLTLSGSGNKTFAAATTINGAFQIQTGTNALINNTITVAATGSTTVDGTLTINSTTGNKYFYSDVTINAGGVWNETVNEAVTFSGNLTNNGTFTANTGSHAFTGVSKNINSITNLTIAAVNVTGSYTNNSTMVVNTSLAGAGTLTQATNSNLYIGGTATITNLNAAATDNSVYYTSTTAAQTMKGTTYYHLIVDKAGRVGTMGAASTINGNLSVLAGTLSDGRYQITGNSTGTLYVANGATLQIGIGTNTTQTFPTLFTTANITLEPASTVNYNWVTGTSQVVAGSVGGVGPSTYGNLTITGTSGTKTLASSILVAGNLRIASAGQIFADGGNTITVNGDIFNAGIHAGTGKILMSGGSAVHNITGGNSTFGNLELDDIQGASFAGTGTKNITGTLKVTSGNLTVNGITTIVNGTTTVDGTLTIANTTGTKTFVGLVTINPGGTWTESVNEAIVFRNGITNNGTFNANTGVHTFNTNSQALTGDFVIPRITVTTPAVLTNNGTLTVGTALAGNGTLTQAAGVTLNLGGTSAITTLNATASGNTVNYTGAAQTVKATTYNDLYLMGSGNKTFGTTTVNGIFDVGSGTTALIANNFTIPASGNVSVNGTLRISNTAGTKTFTGDVLINSGGAWTETVNEAVVFGGNLENNGSMVVTNTGVHTFSGASKTISGANPVDIRYTTITGTYTNNGTLTVNTVLAGAGTLTQGANANLNIGGTSTISNLLATATGNTVNYTGAAQTVKAVDYYHLTLSGSAAKTLNAAITSIEGNFTLNGTATATGVVGLTIGGNFVQNGGTFSNGAYTHNVAGNWERNGGTYTPGTGTINVNGSSVQTIGGSVTTTFNNLTISNSSGIDLALNQTVNGTLTFTIGLINTNIYNLILGNSASISGYSTSGYVNGNLRWGIATSSASKVFPIGDASYYTPVTVIFSGSTNGTGYITAYTTAGEHPDIGTATIDDALSVNRYWTLSNNGVTGFTGYDATFDFINPGDLDVGAVPTSFILGNFNGSTWSYPTVGSALSSSIAVSGLSAFGSYAVGNPSSPAIIVEPLSGLETTEDGGTAQFTIVLQSLPTHDVTIALSSSNTNEGTVLPTSVTFTPGNWASPQTVTVTGVPDGVPDIDKNYSIITGVAVSDDANYNGINPPDVSVINRNTDIPDPLEIDCPGDQNANFSAICDFTLPDYTGLASATGGTGTRTITQSPEATIVVTGNTLITLTVTDELMLTDVCTFTVIVSDNTPPVLDCSAIANPTEAIANGSCTALVPNLLGDVVVSDNCSETANITLVQTPTAGTSVGEGITVITIRATDQANNYSECTIDFEVIDDSPPVVNTCPSNQIRTPNNGVDYLVSGTELDPVFSDNCFLVIINDFNSSSTLSGSSFPPGTTIVEWTATDPGGAEVSCTYDVFVRPSVSLSVDNETIYEDVTPTIATVTATLNIISTETVTVHLGFSGTAVNGSDYTRSGVSIAISPGDLTGSIIITSIDDPIFEADETVIIDISSVTNGAEHGTQQVTITIISDDLSNPPVITCPGNQNESVDSNCEFELPDYTGLAEVTGGAGEVTVTQDPVQGTIISSNTTVTLTATDEALDFDECTFDVILTDNIDPEITCTGNKTVDSNNAGCTYLHADNTWNASATDNCTVSSLTYALSGATTGSGTTLNGVSFNKGETTVTWTASDGTNNDECSFTVIVREINVLVSKESSEPLCPQFLSPFNPDNGSYNEGASEVVFRVTRENSSQDWRFYYEIEEANDLVGFTVLNVMGVGEFTPVINPVEDGGNWYFEVPAINNYLLLTVNFANIMGQSIHVKLTLNTITSSGCTDIDTPDSTLILSAMPVIGLFE
jgi:hypothetical protein